MPKKRKKRLFTKLPNRRKEAIAAVKSFLDSLPDNAGIQVDAQYGYSEKQGQHFLIEREANGTATLTISAVCRVDVNGGARILQLMPDWMRAAYLR